MSTINGTSDDDTLSGTDGDDTINGLGGNDILNGGAGDDILRGGEGDDTLDGGAGIDTLSFADATNFIIGNIRDGSQNTNQGFDRLSNFEDLEGSAFNDLLYGSSGANEISGGAGNDVITGWEGDDVLTGGSGADRFDYSGIDVNGNDTITDLTTEDTIQLFFEITAISVTQVGADVVIALSSGEQITCLNTDVATVNATISPESAVPPPPMPALPDPLPAPPPVLSPAPGSIISTLPAGPDPATSATPFQVAPGSAASVNVPFFGETEFDVWGGLTDYGFMSAKSYYGTSGVDLSNSGSWLVNFGTVAVVSETYAARGITVLNSFNAGEIINYGSVYAICYAGNAHGIWEDRGAAFITNDGLIAVRAFEDPEQAYHPDTGFPRWTGNAYGNQGHWLEHADPERPERTDPCGGRVGGRNMVARLQSHLQFAL